MLAAAGGGGNPSRGRAGTVPLSRGWSGGGRGCRPMVPLRPADASRSGASLALDILDREAEGGDAFRQKVAGHVHAEQVAAGLAGLVPLGGEPHRLLPLLRAVVAAADPGEGDERGLLVLVQPVDELAETVLRHVVGVLLQQRRLAVLVLGELGRV